MLAIGAVFKASIAVGREVLLAAVWSATLDPAFVDVEALIFWKVTFGAKMPFACKERGVSILTKRLGDRYFFKGKFAVICSWLE